MYMHLQEYIYKKEKKSAFEIMNVKIVSLNHNTVLIYFIGLPD